MRFNFTIFQSSERSLKPNETFCHPKSWRPYTPWLGSRMVSSHSEVGKTHWHPTNTILDPKEILKCTFERRLMRFNFTIFQSSERSLKPNETFCHPKSWRPYTPWLGSRMVSSPREVGKNPLTPNKHILDPKELLKRTFERRLMRFNFTIFQSSERSLKPNETFCHPKSWRPYTPWLGSRMVSSHSEVGKNPLTPNKHILDPKELLKRTFERRLMRFNFTIFQSSERSLKPNETFCHPKSWRPYTPWLGSRIVSPPREVGKNPLTPNKHHLRPRVGTSGFNLSTSQVKNTKQKERNNTWG